MTRFYTRVCRTLALFGALTGCTYASISPGGKKVTVVTTTPPNCESLGMITGQGGGYTGSLHDANELLEYALIDARNKAANLGATHFQGSPQFTTVNGRVNSAIYTGIAYRCQ